MENQKSTVKLINGLTLSLLMALSTALSATPSIDTIKSALTEYASDAKNGRVVGTPENIEVRNSLVARLTTLGVSPAGSNGFLQEFEVVEDGNVLRSGANVIGILYPEGTQGQAPTVMLTAHFDGISPEVGHCDVEALPGFSDVCNAAGDNITAVAAALSVIEDLRGKIQSPVAILFFDGEEDVANPSWQWGQVGLLGSSYFAVNPTFSKDSLRLHINLEAIGYDAFSGMENHVFLVGAHSGGTNLKNDADAALTGVNLNAPHAHFGLAQKRTDLEAFVLGDWDIPYLIFTNGSISVYHTNADQYLPELSGGGPLNLDKVHEIAKATASIIETVAAGDRGYVYKDVPLFLLGNTSFIQPPFDQHQVLLDFANQALDNLDSNEYPETHAELTTLKELLESRIASGVLKFFWPINFVEGAKLVQEIGANGVFKASQTHTIRVIKTEKPYEQ